MIDGTKSQLNLFSTSQHGTVFGTTLTRDARNKSSTSRKPAICASTSLGNVSRHGGDQTLPRLNAATADEGFWPSRSPDSDENTSRDPLADVAECQLS